MAATRTRLTLGVDAGATRCRARLRGERGELLAEVEGAAANAYVDFDAAIRAVRDCVERTMAAAMCTSAVKLGLGVAGVSNASEARVFAAAFEGFGNVLVVNDAIAACVGAHGGADGGLIIAGTGTAGVARVEGRETIVGGRGFLLGDDGSAARIGADAVRAALRAADGLARETSLTREIRARFGGDPQAMTRWATQAKPGDYGVFSPLVLEAALKGDAAATPIVEAAARALGALVEAVEALGATRVSMMGGLSAPIRVFFKSELSQRLHAPMFDPIDGAILLAGGVIETSP